MMARAKRIYILIVEVNKLLSTFSSRCFLNEIENMFSMVLSSYIICNSVENGKIIIKKLKHTLISKFSQQPRKSKKYTDSVWYCQLLALTRYDARKKITFKWQNLSSETNIHLSTTLQTMNFEKTVWLKQLSKPSILICFNLLHFYPSVHSLLPFF